METLYHRGNPFLGLRLSMLDSREETERAPVATAVYVCDSSEENHDGDEVRVWDVYLGDDEGESIDNHKTTVSYRSWGAAIRAAEKLAAEHGGLEVVTV